MGAEPTDLVDRGVECERPRPAHVYDLVRSVRGAGGLRVRFAVDDEARLGRWERRGLGTDSLRHT